MSLNDYITRLKDQIIDDELNLVKERKRLGLAQRIRANVEATRNSEGSSLNRDWDGLRKSDDPVRVRLWDLPGFVSRPLIDKMLNRSMNEKEYGLVQNGTDVDIARYVAGIYHKRLLDVTLTEPDRFIAHIDYRLIQEYLRPSLLKSAGKLVGRLLP